MDHTSLVTMLARSLLMAVALGGCVGETPGGGGTVDAPVWGGIDTSGSLDAPVGGLVPGSLQLTAANILELDAALTMLGPTPPAQPVKYDHFVVDPQ
jgi:hypothetical protein